MSNVAETKVFINKKVTNEQSKTTSISIKSYKLLESAIDGDKRSNESSILSAGIPGTLFLVLGK